MARSLLLALGLTLAAHLARAGSPIIQLRNQGDSPILEGSNVTLECFSEEEGEDSNAFTFQKYSQWFGTWVSLDGGSKLPCWFYDVHVSQEGGRLLLTITSVHSWHRGAYRCVSSNATTSNASSTELDLQMEYLHGISLSRTNSWCGTVGSSITVVEGEDLKLLCFAAASQTPLYEWSREGEDWIVASSALTLAKVNRGQAGTYTCRARHPSVEQLAESKSLRVFVEGSDSRWALESVLSQSPPTLALAVALPALLLLLVIIIFAVLIARRRVAAKEKVAQEDLGQRTPIYKGSLESVPSLVGDMHPLVM